MFDAEMYIQSNKPQRGIAQEFLRDFSNKIQWRHDGNDSILDAGCGPGDITVDLVKPILPTNFSRLVGVDISQDMIEYAQKTFADSKLSCEQFDLGIEIEKQSLHGIECVDHILSLNCLHWVHNLRVCFENLYKVLKPGGDMLVVFVLSNPLFNVYKELSEKGQWSKYMYDIDKKEPCMRIINSEQLLEMLAECSFTACDVQVDNKGIIINGIKGLQTLIHPVDPFIDRIPMEQQQSYLDDIANGVIIKCIPSHDSYMDYRDRTIFFHFKRVVGYARK